MSVNYAALKTEPKTEPKLEPTPPIPAIAVNLLEPESPPSPIFLALLSGDVSNRGISWYHTSASNLQHRVALLKKAAKEIEREYYRTIVH